MRLALLAIMNFLQAIVIAALCILPRDSALRDCVDLIEVNHLFDEHGREVFTQAIFYDWSASESRYNVRAWRLVKSPSQLPRRDWESGGYSATWQDAERIRHVRSQAIRETWTQYDVELFEREILPQEKRRQLSK